MPRVSGSPISAEEIERICSGQFDARKFASLCNAVTWASSGRCCTTLPSFTERVNVKDGGIDAEWTVEILNDRGATSALLGPGWNVFQYKQRDIFAQNRAKVFSNIKASLTGAINALYKNSKCKPKRYVTFTNLDLTGKEKTQLRKAILRYYNLPGKVQVKIVGAAELAAFLNDLPRLRATFFDEHRLFYIWEEAWLQHLRLKGSNASVELIGRDHELAELRASLDDTTIRVVIVSGPHQIGKTRLALEATRQRPMETVVALDPESTTVSDLLALESPGLETIVIVEDPDPKQAERFTEQALTRSGLKLFITLPTTENAPMPVWTDDKRVKVLPLGPLSQAQAEALLKEAGADFDFSLMSWVVGQAGGNPGILLNAARLGADLRKSTATFADSVAQAFEARTRRELGDSALEILRLLSLLIRVGVRGRAAQEIQSICNVFGNGIQVNAVLNKLSALDRAGVVRLRGSFAEVSPPLFANGLAASALRGRFAELGTLFAELNPSARLRLLDRLQAVRTDEIKQFWDSFFGADGILRDLASALEYEHLLSAVAGDVPERVAFLIEQGLRGFSLAERQQITGEARRELMNALEELLYRRRTSASALRSMALLAEAETETYGNNATGVFCEYFPYFHPQSPLPLTERLGILKEIVAQENTVEMRLIGIKAIKSGLGHGFAVPLRASRGAEPLDTQPNMTWADVWNYQRAMVDLLMTLAQSEDVQVRQVAQSIVPDCLSNYTTNSRPDEGIARFHQVVEWVLAGQMSISVSHLMKSLHWIEDSLKRHMEQTEDKDNARLQPVLEQTQALINLLDSGSYAIRLKRWVGGWNREDYVEDRNEAGQIVFRGDKAIQDLAEEAIRSPECLTPDLIEWLCSSEAVKAHQFCRWLGQFDQGGKWSQIFERLGTQKHGIYAFAAYLGGRGSIAPQFTNQRIDELIPVVLPEAIVLSHQYFQGDATSITRLINLINEGRADPVLVERVLRYSRFTRSLSPDDYVRLLQAIAGPQFENAASAIGSLSIWILEKKTLEGLLAEFAWQCVESMRPVPADEVYHLDQLAALLARSDPERGLALLERLLSQPYLSHVWEPLGLLNQNAFWNALHNVDRERALQVVFSVARTSPTQRYIPNDLRRVIEQEQDAVVLVKLAQQDEQHAEIVCEALTRERPGFWPVALAIIAHYPNNQELRNILSGGVEHVEGFIKSPWSAHLDVCRQDVQRVRADPATPAAAWSWLDELDRLLNEQIERMRASESDDDIYDIL